MLNILSYMQETYLMIFIFCEIIIFILFLFIFYKIFIFIAYG
jgi:hypothetical protein